MYFPEPGRKNTEATISLAFKRGKELKVTDYVFASSTGYTAKLISNYEGLNLVCVAYQYGFKEPGLNLMPVETRQELALKGVKVLTATHLFRGLDKALSKEYGGSYPPEIVANTLRIFGQGIKVAVEVAVMALDAGLIPYGRDVISIGGTNRGADSALVLRPAHSHEFFKTRIKEIICKPL
jgi:hypothetical protein